MIFDNYKLKSNIGKERRGVNQNIRNFLSAFTVFYNGIRMHTKPNFVYELKDPYGFALLCEDYSSETMNVKYDINKSCKDIFEGKGEENNLTDYDTYHCQFTFKEILDLLYLGFLFDYQKAIDVYHNQHNALDIFTQIIHGNGYIYNRLRPDLKKSQGALKYAMESSISLNENLPIKIPHVWRLCDGMAPPFIVQKYNSDIHIETANCHGFGEGIFLISDNQIIDCLKINDTWFTDLPLEHRLSFAFKCTDYDVAQYGKAWSLRSILEVGEMLGANSTQGLLIRGARESFFKNRWFSWSKTSLVYCKKVNGELVSKTAGNIKPTFYTLEGDEGLISPLEERKHERVYLDDWDIREFQKILTLGD